MRSEEQFQQLLLQYNQLIAGAQDIALLIEKEDFDGAITLLQSREQLFLSCKNILNYLELSENQKEIIDNLVNKLRELEQNNISRLQKGMAEVQAEIAKTQKSQKLQNAYGGGSEDTSGNIFNSEE